MTANELLTADFDLEATLTRRMLERVPEEQARDGWQPHPKSMPLGKLAMHTATLPMFTGIIMNRPSFDLKTDFGDRPQLVYTTREDLLATADKYAAEARANLHAANGDSLGDEWKFSMGEHVISNHNRVLTYRMFAINHMIHHRVQIGVYLRLLDLPVPSTYGPSADEQA
jgi:uncharacterized damage-inducible protein DinB